MNAALTAAPMGEPRVTLMLYSPVQMLLAALLGGPVAAFFMLASNRAALGRARSTLPTIAAGWFIAFALSAVARALPRGVPADISFFFALLASRARLSAAIPLAFSLVFWAGLRLCLARDGRGLSSKDVSAVSWSVGSVALLILFTNLAVFLAVFWSGALKVFASRAGWGL